MQTLKAMLAGVQRKFGMADADRLAARSAEVRVMFKDAITHCYHEAAPQVLAHVNAVHILKETEKEVPTTSLVVYMDDANFRSDVIARQYFILLWLKERYGQSIDIFKAYSSRAGMRKRHAFNDMDEDHRVSSVEEIDRKLTEEEERALHLWASKIEDPGLRSAYLKAARSAVARWGSAEEKTSDA